MEWTETANSAWQLNEIGPCSEGKKQSTNFVFQRSFDVVHFLVVVPSVTLYSLSTLVFVIPVESGEKATFMLTLFLAQTFLYTSCYDYLPNKGEDGKLPNLILLSAFLSAYLALLLVFAITS